MPRRAVLTYDGTRLHSSGAHSLRVKSFVAAGEALERFRLTCTDARPPSLIRLDLKTLLSAAPRGLIAVGLRFSEMFGPPAAANRSSDGLSNWFLTEAQLRPALQIMDSFRPIPTDQLGFGLFGLLYKLEFAFRVPGTDALLPFQTQTDYLGFEGGYDRFLGRSTIAMDLSAQSFVSVFFSLPFEEWSAEAAALVRFIQQELPFRISERRWKKWTLTKSGQSYVGRKMAVSW